MARSRSVQLSSIALSNIILPISVLIFASGFFPYKPFLPGLATFPDVQDNRDEHLAQPEAIFDRVVFMVVDALRSDFVYGHGSGFDFTQGLIRDGAAIPFTAHATPPTVTMPRVKALTTGSVPSFLDLILNFAESDTSSSLAAQDTWLAQLRAARDGKLVFYGDDTWLKLFPNAGGEAAGEDDFWLRQEGTSSFFVSDFTEVDVNVTRHVPAELGNSDWSAMVLHYLGLDHIGHKTGPQGPNMLPKQREMDGIVRLIYEAMEREAHHDKTLLVLAGDHGMNAGGNHGGSGPGETEPALVFASPRFKSMEKRMEYQCPTLPKEGTEFHYYTKIGQSDLVPTLAGLMGMPVSKNSLGVIARELAGLWSAPSWLQLLHQNSLQILHIVRAKYGVEWFDATVARFRQELKEVEQGFDERGEAFVDVDMEPPTDDGERLAWQWAVLSRSAPPHRGLGADGRSYYEGLYYEFLERAQSAMSDTASSYNIPRMVAGMALSGVALVFALVSLPSLWPPSSAGLFFALISALYGVMMFASSYVEEEQHFWYWLTPAWIALLSFAALRNQQLNTTSRVSIAAATFALLATHRLCVRWNQTGQKHAGEPDIVQTFFPAHHVFLWLLILGTYLANGYFLHTRSFAGLFMPELAAFFTTSLVFLGVVFKLNFTQADAPELVQGLAEKIRELSEPFSLVWQARAVFGFLAVATVAMPVLDVARRRLSVISGAEREKEVPMTERLHHLLTLFLMTQTRAPNVPLFALLEIQRASLSTLLHASDQMSSRSATHRTVQVATSALLLSHTYYFCTGGSNSISSIDLSNAYNGVADYNIAAVGLLLFASNWSGPLWWCSAAVLLLLPQSSTPEREEWPKGGREWIESERRQLANSARQPTFAANSDGRERAAGSWSTYLSCMTVFIATSLVAVMAACTVLRAHLFIWTVFSPKYLYAMAWAVGWHMVVNAGMGSLLWRIGR